MRLWGDVVPDAAALVLKRRTVVSPFELEEVLRKARNARPDQSEFYQNGVWTHSEAVRNLLMALVQHAADKEAEHNLATVTCRQ